MPHRFKALIARIALPLMLSPRRRAGSHTVTLRIQRRSISGWSTITVR